MFIKFQKRIVFEVKQLRDQIFKITISQTSISIIEIFLNIAAVDFKLSSKKPLFAIIILSKKISEVFQTQLKSQLLLIDEIKNLSSTVVK